MDATINIAGLGNVRYDLAFGGAFYAFVKKINLILIVHKNIIVNSLQNLAFPNQKYFKIFNNGSPYKSRNEFFVWHYFYWITKGIKQP